MHTLITAALSSIAFSQKQGQMTSVETRGEVPYRLLGGTGVHVSMIGLGGFHIGQESVTGQESARLIRPALDPGLNFIDNPLDYHHIASPVDDGSGKSGGV